MQILVFHPRFAAAIASRLKSEHPGAVVSTVSDVSCDPPGLDRAEILVANRFPDGMLGRMPRLRVVQLTGVGIEHLAAGDPTPGLRVATAGDVPAVSVAEFAWMGVLSIAKRAPLLLEQQRTRTWRLPAARRIAGTTLLLVGLGRIGREIAARAAAFGVTVIGVRRTSGAVPGVSRVVSPADLHEVIPQADHLILALPSSPSTRGLFGRRELELLQDDAALVNVGRAEVLDVGALVDAVRRGRLRGVLLDVHEEEPLAEDSPLWSTERIWVTPHCAHEYERQTDDLAVLCSDNVGRYERGEALRNEVEVVGATPPSPGGGSEPPPSGPAAASALG
jgi:phosphoglycerate dehydrogenase-like enzyme